MFIIEFMFSTCVRHLAREGLADLITLNDIFCKRLCDLGLCIYSVNTGCDA